jgi:drug/metabolite transporter (DMT)-like permease
MNRTIGILLIVIGLIGVVWGGITYTTRDKVADIGPIHVSDEKHHSIPLPPIAGAIALIGGVVLLVSAKQ